MPLALLVAVWVSIVCLCWALYLSHAGTPVTLTLSREAGDVVLGRRAEAERQRREERERLQRLEEQQLVQQLVVGLPCCALPCPR